MTDEERRKDFKMWLDGIEDMLKHRCYTSDAAARSMAGDVQKHLNWALAELNKIEQPHNSE